MKDNSKPSGKGMDRLIQLVSKLQDVFSTVDAASQEMQLPQIVVVGDQSAGKSSLLERIVRRDFLPRGTGIVTRQPLVLDLIRTPIGDRRRKRPGAPAEGDFALFEGVEKVYTDFEEVREGIEELTRKTCGSNKGVSDKRIHLRIYSEHVVDLSLVDLPGLTRVAVGDQPEDIPEQIRGMIETFIANENTIILAVTPANVDLATSEPLKLAKQFDPKGDRTIAVLTKLDLMDKGTSAEHVLLGHTIPVKLGIVGVVNRSQQDLNNNKSLDAMEDDEIAFFKKKYPHLAAVNGSNYLAQRLNEILIGHIKRCLPALVVRIHDKTAEKKRKLIELGESFSDPNNAVVKTVTQFTQTFNALSFDGCAVMDKEDRSPAAKISSIFHDDFPDEIDQLNPLEGVRRDDVDAFLRNATGLNPHVFIPPTAFTSLLSKQILRLIEPSLNVVDEIKEELIATVRSCNVGGIYDRFPMLQTRIQVIVEDELEQQVEETKRLITNYIESEAAYISTRHPTFDQFYKKLYRKEFEKKNAVDAKEEKKHEPGPYGDVGVNAFFPSDEESDEEYDGDKRNVRLIRKLVPAYFVTVKCNIKDAIPKLIVKNMVRYLHENLMPVLMTKLLEDVEELFKEDQRTVAERNHCLKLLEALKKAEKCIREIGQVY
ncbi:unnamed protein product [Bursaphelenchus xylophilus]|uniref:(pine wood nematode) hypothetical protein n=1 Tax=Bursaphelenchus xylophilus TaxID=6326 RepID=A0A7I8WRZ3_BURXY|nr:unnamed protein product [Bursaphelenchus xylophilus]CAG9114976.1 unnamed protein product [Bursaphelenchus xylophilus]